ncbi:HlyD family type I secretion periplasmic adaptor subunit [Agrobacterium sp. AGB01]|uniref:HlyD family type I secretion periplasmic adaptor subunit n=1 Tax=Agrobacterium sp. AGB01 TaxID=2769302 RepID=UPI001782DFDE|nr:HlyD family type I secretion periplasmic adaptor subunit [Agrobacterium sp. AGB01]MBD9388223.1 HlyD family type I secretion periplasmic adaptor subunit [Agrobacterium sp. AGB01]
MAKSRVQERSSDGWAQKSLRRHLAAVFSASFLLVVGIGGWAFSQQIASAVIASGVVAVDGNVKKIQHFTGGNISEIRINEGQKVKAGEVLFVLNGNKALASRDMIEKLLAQLYMQRARLMAEMKGETTVVPPPEAEGLPGLSDFVTMEQDLLTSRRLSLAAMIDQLNSRQVQLDDEIGGYEPQLQASDEAISSTEQELAIQEKLFAKKAVGSQRMLQLRREKASYESDRAKLIAGRASALTRKGEVKAQLINMTQTRLTETSTSLADTQRLILENEEKRSRAQDEIDHLEITSPVDGRALQLTVHTKNGVISPGQDLVLIVPDDQQLDVEARIQTRDVDQIRVGQQVRLRFAAFNQRTTPEIEGKVVNVAADAITDPATRQLYYAVKIQPDPESMKKVAGLDLYPGMPVEVFAHIAERTVISYLMKPLMDQVEHAFREE